MIDLRSHGKEQEYNTVPPRALAISLVALAVAGLAAIAWPTSLDELAGMVWLLALIPAFLFAYYRGWEGAAGGVLVAMILMIAIEIVPALIVGTEVDWRIAGGVAFMGANRGLLDRAEGEYGVPPEIVTAIIAMAKAVWCKKRRMDDMFDLGCEFYWVGWKDDSAQKSLADFIKTQTDACDDEACVVED